jgi:hypothetical protein
MNEKATPNCIPTHKTDSSVGLDSRHPRAKKRKLYDTLDLSPLPPGQRRAVEALIGGGVDRTYVEAAKIGGMAEGTMLTHINRVRRNHPELYESIRVVRKIQLAARHRIAVQNAIAHSRRYFRRQNRMMRQVLGHLPFG